MHLAASLGNLQSTVHAEVNSGSAVPITAIRELLTANAIPTDGSAQEITPKTILRRRHTFSGGRKRVSFDLESNEIKIFQPDETLRHLDLEEKGSTNGYAEHSNVEIFDYTLKTMSSTTIATDSSVLLNEARDTESSAATNDDRSECEIDVKITDTIPPVENATNSSESLELELNDNVANGERSTATNSSDLLNESADAQTSAVTNSDYEIPAANATNSNVSLSNAEAAAATNNTEESSSGSDSDGNSDSSSESEPVVPKQPMYMIARSAYK